ncbi:MAG: biotin/lipoyl-binding protein [Anaerolineae bacterium]|nr:biotin/lipoyl-binding protein [Anaerolineae bacterium]
MIRKLLIANRGEIACRIIRTCRELGIATVAIYSDADANALHVELADEAVRVGPGPAPESYLHVERIIAAAQRAGADAVHPGYGFLAENAEFARVVSAAGLIFVGPPADVIAQMGSKIEAKRIAQGAGVPVVPGYDGADQSDARLIAAANAIGYPVMIKASAGGGGKGMREVDRAEAMVDALAAARREAMQAFGDATLMLEKRIARPRHVEIQIFGDSHGRVIALGERECSLQRRHQKIVEETPSPALDDALRARMSEAAVAIGQAIGYVNAGTVEFILDEAKQFYFLEVNTRLQVEHPVTELATGIDLVRLQLAIADGGSLPESVTPSGHAIEVRLYAEDPAHDFLPVTGDVLCWEAPASASSRLDGSLVIDSGIRGGDTIGPFYDPTLAKAIAHGATRAEAIRRLDFALAQIRLFGLRSNLAFLRRLLADPDFAAGDIDTGFIERHPELLADVPPPDWAWMAAALAETTAKGGAHFRNNPYRPITHTFAHGEAETVVRLTPRGDDGYTVEIGDLSHEARLIALSGGEMTLIVDGHRRRVGLAHDRGCCWWVGSEGASWALRWIDPLPAGGGQAQAEGSLRAPMPGNVIAVQVTDGQRVAAGDVLLIMEAMKMEHRIKAPYDGVVAGVHYAVGDFAQAGAVLLDLQPE